MLMGRFDGELGGDGEGIVCAEVNHDSIALNMRFWIWRGIIPGRIYLLSWWMPRLRIMFFIRQRRVVGVDKRWNLWDLLDFTTPSSFMNRGLI